MKYLHVGVKLLLYMQKKPINVSVIIVRYKIKNELFDCIASIIQSKPKVSYEIVIVDNNIDERIGKELLKKFPKVIYVENSKNSGFGSGINLGVFMTADLGL